MRLPRHTRVRACALALAAVAVSGVLTQAGTQAGAASGDPAGRVQAAQVTVRGLSDLVEQSARELRAGTEALEQSRARSTAARAKADATRGAADAALAESTTARTELAAVVVRNFKNPPPSTLSAVLSTERGALSEAVLAAHDREVLEGNQRDLLRRAEAARVRAEGLVVSAEQLEAEAAREETAAAEQEQALRALAKANQVKLQTAFAELEKAQAAKRAYDAEQARLRELARQRALSAARQRAAAEAAEQAARNRPVYVPSFDDSGAGCSGGSTDGYPNGFIPSSALCSIGGGHRLRADAAAAFRRMDAAYGGLCVTDSYRSYAAQVDVYQRKPNLAAIPGTSNHGLGIAVDFCGGINRFGSAAHEWMVANAGSYGWWHPFWARQGGSKPEAWHWEYIG